MIVTFPSFPLETKAKFILQSSNTREHKAESGPSLSSPEQDSRSSSVPSLFVSSFSVLPRRTPRSFTLYVVRRMSYIILNFRLSSSTTVTSPCREYFQANQRAPPDDGCYVRGQVSVAHASCESFSTTTTTTHT